MLLRTRRKGRGVSVETRPAGISPSQRLRQVVDPDVIEFPILQVDSPVSYLTAFFVPAFDAVCPVLPSETVIVALGVSTAGSVDPRIGLLIGLAAFGAFAGDNLCYFIGRRFSSTMNRHFFSGDRGAKEAGMGRSHPWSVRRSPYHCVPIHPRWSDNSHTHLRSHGISATYVSLGHRTCWPDLGELCVRCRPGEWKSVRKEPLAEHRGSARHRGSGHRGGGGHAESRRVVEDTSHWSIWADSVDPRVGKNLRSGRPKRGRCDGVREVGPRPPVASPQCSPMVSRPARATNSNDWDREGPVH